MIFLKETAHAPHLKASLPSEEYLDTLSAPRIEPGGKSKEKVTTSSQGMLAEKESRSAAESRPLANAKGSSKGKGKKAAESKE